MGGSGSGQQMGVREEGSTAEPGGPSFEAAPQLVAGQYVLSCDRVRLVVDPALGARITELSYDGKNFLTDARVNADNWGSTFWTSPQAAWGWPPLAAHDTAPYQATVEGQTLVLVSDVTSSPFAVRVTKRFSVERGTGAVVLAYSMRNEGADSIQLAPWEISRHAAEGITFFPTGERVMAPALRVVQQAGITWYKSVPSEIRGELGDKYVADGSEGWLGHTDGELLLVKSFPDLPPGEQAPGEGEIEIYGNKPTATLPAYVEVEAQGPYQTLAAGQSVTWTVRWYLTKLPEGASAAVGSEALVRLARSLNARSPSK